MAAPWPAIISVDFQKDFSAKGGACFRPRPCVDFVKGVLVPYFEARQLRVAEIVSDYRLPNPAGWFESCIPGTPGFESEIPDSVKDPRVWVKCMNSPIWVRENGGVPGRSPGMPYQDPAAFTAWLGAAIGPPESAKQIVLIGLTLDCCVLCMAQELCFRGYQVRFLVEGVDAYSGSQREKHSLLRTPLHNWGSPLTWEELRSLA